MGMGPALEAARSSTTRVRSVIAQDFVTGAFAQLEETGDGTARAFVGTFLSPTVFLGIAFAEPSAYSISTIVQPGQSGQGSGSGTGHFELEGVFAFDFITFMPVGPLDVSVDIAVADPTPSVGANTSQGVTAQFNPSTGETSIVRQHIIGNQAYGDTAGSLSILVDDGGGFVPVIDATGVWGLAGINRIHLVEQIH
jgi:hypothetical protein